MTREVSLREQAINQAAGYLQDDPEGLTRVFAAIDDLPLDPRPAGSFPLGSPDARRLRVGRYRVIYEIQKDLIWITHIGRTPAGS